MEWKEGNMAALMKGGPKRVRIARLYMQRLAEHHSAYKLPGSWSNKWTSTKAHGPDQGLTIKHNK